MEAATSRTTSLMAQYLELMMIAITPAANGDVSVRNNTLAENDKAHP